MEKKFERPELIIIQFASEDIIVTSGDEDKLGGNGEIDFDEEV